MKKTLLVLLAFVPALAALDTVHHDALAAESFACGGGKPNAKTGKCDCPKGWHEWTMGTKSTCQPDAPPPPKCPTGMAPVAGGTYTTGDLMVSATVAALCVDITEVTQAAYETCATGGACTAAFTSCLEPSQGNKVFTENCPCNSGVADRQNHPANCMDWAQSATYCAAQGKRLPTEQEWEWVARGGAKGNTYPWGNAAPAKQLCWSGTQSRQITCPVGAFPDGNTPNGIKDLDGNVYEWTSSRPDATSSAMYVYRGGAAFTSDAKYLAVSQRSWDYATGRWSGVGFRCVKTL